MNGARNLSITCCAALLIAWVSSVGFGQVQDVQLQVPREQLGLQGFARLGAWTAIRMTLENKSAEPRQVVCRWLLNDADGDRVLAERRLTLDALGKQDAWMYGPLPIRWRSGELWSIQVLNDTLDVQLDHEEVAPPELMSPQRRLIGVTGSYSLGLDRHLTPYTSHEPITLVTGLSLTTLPDRWYGLSMLDTLIWTRYGGAPDDPLVSSATQQALREWVRRGGHLVIMLPAFGESWTGSGMNDLLPIRSDQIRRITARPPSSLGALRTTEALDIEMCVFDVRPSDGVDVVMEFNNQPIIVAKRFGFGRVTVFGMDLSDRRFAQMGLPNGRYPVWNDVFMWQAPIYEKAYIEGEVNDNKMSREDQRAEVPLGRFIPGRVSMRGAAAPALLLAILLFGLYWFTAGPLSLIVLKRRGSTRHSWIAFVAVVLIFSAVSWAGAWLMAPKQAAISHFSILTASADSPSVHTHSWLSIYLPKFATQTIEIDPDHPSARQVLSSPGMTSGMDETGFLDPQTYTLDAAAPRTADIPFRSTAKQLEVDYLGRVDLSQTGLREPLILPQGQIKLVNSIPTGKLSHGLPGPLRDVVMLYCPGGGEVPFVWKLQDAWEPSQVVDLSSVIQEGRLVQRPNDSSYIKRPWLDEGYLGRVIKTQPGQVLIDATGVEVVTTSSDTIRYIEMLSFFDALPPPDFRNVGIPYAVTYSRGLGRQLDLSPLFAGRRLIVMGHLEDGPLPLPMTVEGEEVTANGWTVVRWVYDLE